MLEVFFRVFGVFIFGVIFCLNSGGQSDPRGFQNDVKSEVKVVKNEGQKSNQTYVMKKSIFRVPQTVLGRVPV